MKKIISFLVCLVLIFSFSVTAFAAEPVKVNSTASVGTPKLGDTITVTVSLGSSAEFKSMSLTPSYDANVFELVSGEWVLTGSQIANFNNKNAVIAFENAVKVSGNVFKYVLKVKDSAALADTTIKTTAVIKNGSTEIATTATSTTVKVICKTHTFGDWSKADNNNHKRTCSACNTVETSAHAWNKGEVTKAATCKEAGVKTYTCTAAGCGATKTEAIAKTTAHTFGNWTETKAPTCTEKGSQTRTCTTCQKVETKEVAANGHKFASPTVTKQPTCTETGIEAGKCTVCNKETTNTIKATGHKYGEAVVSKEATETEEGLKTSTCEVCGDVKEETIPALSAENESSDVQSTEDPLEPDTDTDVEVDADTDADTNADDNDPLAEKDSSNWWIYVIIAAGIVLGGALIIVAVKKR